MTHVMTPVAPKVLTLVNVIDDDNRRMLLGLKKVADSHTHALSIM
jgi:hypothetical protein